ncbi:MAG: hypothetical protein NTW87_17370 [Planctomycetota bacterium]|nr:hypothetical protein [Planctomycetota bacterium]
MADLVVHGVDRRLVTALKRNAARSGQQLDTYVRSALAAAVTKRRRSAAFHDLDHLAGTWTRRQHDEFASAIARLDKVDKEMW